MWPVLILIGTVDWDCDGVYEEGVHSLMGLPMGASFAQMTVSDEVQLCKRWTVHISDVTHILG